MIKWGAARSQVLGNMLEKVGSNDEAYRYYTRAVEAFECLGSLADVAQAEIDRELVASDPAIALIRKRAVTIREALGDKVELAAALDNLGLLFGEAGNHEAAIALMERSSFLAEEAGDTTGICAVLCNLGAVCEEAKLVGKAIDYYERALPLIKSREERDAPAALDALRATQA